MNKASQILQENVKLAYENGVDFQIHVHFDEHLEYSQYIPIPSEHIFVHPVGYIRLAERLKEVGFLQGMLGGRLLEMQKGKSCFDRAVERAREREYYLMGLQKKMNIDVTTLDSEKTSNTEIALTQTTTEKITENTINTLTKNLTKSIHGTTNGTINTTLGINDIIMAAQGKLESAQVVLPPVSWSSGIQPSSWQWDSEEHVLHLCMWTNMGPQYSRCLAKDLTTIWKEVLPAKMPRPKDWVRLLVS